MIPDSLHDKVNETLDTYIYASAISGSAIARIVIDWLNDPNNFDTAQELLNKYTTEVKLRAVEELVR